MTDPAAAPRPDLILAPTLSHPLSVGFDGRALTSPAGGVRRYTRELFAAMAALGTVTVTALGATRATEPIAGVRSVPPAPSLPTNVGRMFTGLPLTMRRARTDVFHAPAYTSPAWPAVPVVLTIHDVSYERHPEWYPYRRDPLRRAFYRRCARSADRIVTDSEFSRREIVEAYAIDPARIDVVPLAPAPLFAPGPAAPLPAPLPPRCLLHVGDLHVRRNLGVVARALAALRQRRADLRDVRVVLAGVRREDAAWTSLPADLQETLVPLGFVDEPTLLALYRGAAAFVYPSRYEGFGLPILEAMACGVPVVASRSSCLPEVAGDAALLVDPDDDAAWAASIESVLDDDGIAARLRGLGLERAARFSWSRTALETCLTYVRALGRG